MRNDLLAFPLLLLIHILSPINNNGHMLSQKVNSLNRGHMLHASLN